MKTALQKHILHAEEKRMKDEDIANIEISKSLSLGFSGNSAATVKYTRRKDSMKDNDRKDVKIEISLISFYESRRGRGKTYVILFSGDPIFDPNVRMHVYLRNTCITNTLGHLSIRNFPSDALALTFAPPLGLGSSSVQECNLSSMANLPDPNTNRAIALEITYGLLQRANLPKMFMTRPTHIRQSLIL
jgi:hypothetical protein